jgi:hypothetical protein
MKTLYHLFSCVVWVVCIWRAVTVIWQVDALLTIVVVLLFAKEFLEDLEKALQSERAA